MRLKHGFWLSETINPWLNGKQSHDMVSSSMKRTKTCLPSKDEALARIRNFAKWWNKNCTDCWGDCRGMDFAVIHPKTREALLIYRFVFDPANEPTVTGFTDITCRHDKNIKISKLSYTEVLSCLAVTEAMKESVLAGC
jgi:hypothetical protein